MASQTPPFLALLAALTLTLAACGGGTTGQPAATPTDAASAPATTAQPAATTGAPRTTAATPAPTAQQRQRQRAVTTTQPQPAPQSQPATSPAHAAAPATTTAPHQAPAKAAPQPAGTPLSELAVVTLADKASPAHYFQQGTVTGTFDGTISLEARITSKGVVVDFTATLAGGTIVGRGLAIPIVGSSPYWGLRGTAAIVSGSGRFASVHGRGLQVTGRAKPDGSRARVQLTGTVTY
ncbi:MAG TPA: hypothetical protein VFF79_02285 [Conexibacter sp.]|nr:hypothetical protein [Conexibacter sp.]